MRTGTRSSEGPLPLGDFGAIAARHGSRRHRRLQGDLFLERGSGLVAGEGPNGIRQGRGLYEMKSLCCPNQEETSE